LFEERTEDLLSSIKKKLHFVRYTISMRVLVSFCR